MPSKKKSARKICGIIMPISQMKVGDITYSAEYWSGVLSFLMDAIKDAGFEPIVAWENNKSDIIHAKIVQNIATQDVMVGLLVGNNPNVWLECGMRLWTQKPLLLLVSDKVEKIPFDVSPVNCLIFPEDCHYGRLKILKKEIKDSLKRISAQNYPSILSHFATLTPATESPAVKEVELEKFMTETRDALNKMQSQIDTARATSWLSDDISRLGRVYNAHATSLSASGRMMTKDEAEALDESYRKKYLNGCLLSAYESRGPTGPTYSPPV